MQRNRNAAVDRLLHFVKEFNVFKREFLIHLIWKTVVILSKFAIEKLADELYNGRNVPAHEQGAEYGPHWDTLSLP